MEGGRKAAGQGGRESRWVAVEDRREAVVGGGKACARKTI